MTFFSEGLREMAEGAVATARKLESVAAADRQRSDMPEPAYEEKDHRGHLVDL